MITEVTVDEQDECLFTLQVLVLIDDGKLYDFSKVTYRKMSEQRILNWQAQ